MNSSAEMPEGRYCHILCTAIAPFWLSIDELFREPVNCINSLWNLSTIFVTNNLYIKHLHLRQLCYLANGKRYNDGEISTGIYPTCKLWFAKWLSGNQMGAQNSIIVKRIFRFYHYFGVLSRLLVNISLFTLHNLPCNLPKYFIYVLKVTINLLFKVFY